MLPHRREARRGALGSMVLIVLTAGFGGTADSLWAQAVYAACLFIQLYLHVRLSWGWLRPRQWWERDRLAEALDDVDVGGH